MTGGGKIGATGSFLGVSVGDVARHPRDISKTAGLCCDIVCATLCSATGVSARVCHQALKITSEIQNNVEGKKIALRPPPMQGPKSWKSEKCISKSEQP